MFFLQKKNYGYKHVLIKIKLINIKQKNVNNYKNNVY